MHHVFLQRALEMFFKAQSNFSATKTVGYKEETGVFRMIEYFLKYVLP